MPFCNVLEHYNPYIYIYIHTHIQSCSALTWTSRLKGWGQPAGRQENSKMSTAEYALLIFKCLNEKIRKAEDKHTLLLWYH